MRISRWTEFPLAAKMTIGLAVAGALVLSLWMPVLGADEPRGELGLRVMGQSELLADSPASLRIMVTDPLKQAPVARALVSVRLARAEGGVAQVLFTGRTDRLGTVRAEFHVPGVPDGDYKLIVHAQAGDKREKATQQVSIRRGFQILLTTDKPIYQPTQTMHLRALALRLPRLNAASAAEITLEVSDAKGNKVFKQTENANDFGIVAADFILADEVNLGRYKVKALLGDDEAEKTVTVKRYVLPKFRVSIDADRDYYLPGQHVQGTVQADYFFGKPVAGGKVKLTVKTFDFEFRDLATIDGTTDDEGSFKFEADLPSSFVGQPVEQGKAFLQFEAEVTDQAEHTETAMATSTVAAADLEVNAVPESGNLVPGVDNMVHVMVSRPTGEPATARVSLGAVTWPDGEQDLLTLPAERTDDLGIAQFTLPAAFTAKLQPAQMTGVPAGLRQMAAAFGAGSAAEGATVTINVTAKAADGTQVRKDVVLTADPSSPDTSLLLRTDRALYKVGDRLTATALTGVGAGTAYFDVVKDRQTMLTHAAPIEAGQATTRIVLGPQVSGTAWLSAYVITPLGQIVRDQRPIYVDPAADLAIDINADKDTYAPGSEARLDFTVKDATGRPVAAALGINVVDESVFALQELQPGMEKVYFFLEQELMKPRYEIHGFEMPTIITEEPGVRPAAWERKDRAAQIIFASIEPPELNVFEVDTYAQWLETAKQEWLDKLAPQVERIQQAAHEYQNKHQEYPPVEGGATLLVREGLLKEDDLKDLWGRELIVESTEPEGRDLRWIVAVSTGPDGKRDTMDDLVMPGYNPRAAFNVGHGGRGGMWLEEREMAAEGGAFMLRAAAAPPGALADEVAGTKAGVPPAAAPEKESVRVRKYFPETMFFEPALITGPDGKATLTMPMADSITTWRMACLANSATGQLGSTTQGLRCFQDFFIDIDLPVALTQNDQVSIPVAVYNYLPQEQTVRLELTREPWFELSGEDTVEMKIASNDVDVRYFTIKAGKIGDHQLTVHGLGPHMSDAISRKIRVEPDGRKIEQTVSDRLEKSVQHTLNIPEGALDDASNILVKVYPGVFSQVVEGLDSMLRMPFGCFEQTTACTYPNILVLDYMRTTDQVTPEIDMKASGLINTGYQRMVSYECPGHGFSWFGDEPANKMLTAHGLMAFYDMQGVHNVDPNIISRTQQWLLAQQEDDGSWKPEEHYLHQETWTRIQNSDLLPTAYATWALASTQCKDAGVSKGVAYVRKHWEQAEEPYSLAICCNALVTADKVLQEGDLDDATIEALNKLIDMAKTEGEKMWWESEITGITHSSGDCADLEATGYAGLALLTSGRYPGPTSQVISYLVSKKDPNGTWYSTQATILALKVLLLSQGKATQEINAEIEVEVNGQQAAAFALTPDNADVMRLVDCKQFVKRGENTVAINFGGKGSCLYQIVSRHYVPWREPDVAAGKEPLTIDVSYDRAKLAKDDILTAGITVRNNTPLTTSMIIVDLGIPPGFAVEGGDLAELVDMNKIQKYKLTGRQIIAYFEKLEPRQTVEFSYRLRAKFPIKAKTPKSTVYEYYNPDNSATARPVEIEVTG